MPNDTRQIESDTVVAPPRRVRKSFLNDSLLWRLIRESVPEHKGQYAAAIAAMVVVAATTALSAWIMGEIVNSMGSGSRDRVIAVAGGVALIFFLKGVASFVQSVLMARAGNRIVARKQSLLFRRLLTQGIAFFNTTESSDLILRVTQSAQMARGVIDTIVTGYVRDLLTLMGLLAVMFYQQPVLSLVCLLIGPVALLGVRMLLKKVRHVMAQELAGLTEIIRVLQEASIGARVVKAFGLEERMAGRMDYAIRTVEKRSNKMIRLEAATTPLMDTITGLAIASIVMLSTVSMFGQEVGNPGQLMSFVTAFLMAYEPAKRLSRMRINIESSMVGVRMMYSLLDEPITVAESANPVDLPPGPGNVALNTVDFSYGGDGRVFQNLSLDFPAGKTTALVGPSGGGKSTILNLILRLYDPEDGTVTIDGHDIKEASSASLRRKIAFVGQDTFLFSSTILDNIRLARPDATDEEVHEAAGVAHAREFIDRLPKGYDTKIGENGTFLSGGQRQRLSIARAVLRRAPILLLDEATSALDGQSESLVREALGRITTGTTTIIVAHRLSTILTADRICYIENGEVLEQGSLHDLLALGGKFRALYRTQFGGES